VNATQDNDTFPQIILLLFESESIIGKALLVP